jgi:hypothetical protein
MDKAYLLEELKQVTGFLEDLPVNVNTQTAVIDSLSYAVYLVNQLQEDPLYPTFVERLEHCITQLSDNAEQPAILSSTLAAAIKVLKHYIRSVSRKLNPKESFLRKLGF